MQRQRLLTRTPLHSEHGSVAAHEGGAADALSGSGELFEVTKRTPACSLEAAPRVRVMHELGGVEQEIFQIYLCSKDVVILYSTLSRRLELLSGQTGVLIR
jgi:hypothetical protein